MLAAVLAVPAAWADLAAARAEPNLERRAELALVDADESLTAARKQYDAGEFKGFEAQVREVSEAVQLAEESLAATQKDPARRPKHFKRAELRLRELLRRVNSLHHDVSEQDRAAVETVRRQIADANERMLLGVMGRKK